MNKDEIIKEVYTLMVKNNPDEAIKTLIMYDKKLNMRDKKIHKLKSIIYKALHLIDHNDIYDYRVFEEMLTNILRGENNE